jgi:2-oxoglutarate ferredoxin oxidoreductase subunit alpha
MELPDPKAQLGVIGWGSTQGAIHEAILKAQENSIHIRWLQCKLLSPLPETQIAKFLAGLKKIVVPELNYTSQFANYLRTRFEIDSVPLTKTEGLPFTPNEILRKIQEVA